MWQSGSLEGTTATGLELGRLILLGVGHFSSLLRKPTLASPRIGPFCAFEGVST